MTEDMKKFKPRVNKEMPVTEAKKTHKKRVTTKYVKSTKLMGIVTHYEKMDPSQFYFKQQLKKAV